MTDQNEWFVDCRDGFGRPAQVAVRVRDDHVTVQWPPGETAELTVTQSGALHRVLLTAGARAAGATW